MRRKVLLLYAVNIFYWMNLYTFVPVFPAYSAGIVSTGAIVGLISGSYGLMQLVLRIPLGVLSDKLQRRKPFVVAGALCGIISVVGLYFFASPAALLIFRALTGVAASMYVQLTVLYSSTCEETGVPVNMGALTASSSLGQISGMLLGGLVGDFSGAGGTFLLGAGAGLIALLCTLPVKDTGVAGAPLTLAQLKDVVKSRPLLVSAGLAVLSQAVIFGKSFTFSPIAAQALNATVFQSSIITALALVPQTFLSPLASRRLVPRFGLKAVTCAGFAVIALSCVLTPLWDSVAGLCASQLLTGVGNAAVFPCLMAHSLEGIAPARRSSAMGFFQAVYGLGMFAGPWLTGYIVDIFSMDISFYFNAIIALAGAILCLALFQTKRNNQERVS